MINHATQYRSSADGQNIEEIPGTSKANPRYVLGTTQANEIPWLIEALRRPGRSFAYRVYNEFNAATSTALQRLRNGTFGAQFCTAGCLSPSESNRTGCAPWIPTERASGSAPPTTEEIYEQVEAVEEKVLAQELHDLTKPKVCVLPKLYDLPGFILPSRGDGSCEAPEAFPPGGGDTSWFHLGRSHLAETIVPWASWDIDKGRGPKKRPT